MALIKIKGENDSIEIDAKTATSIKKIWDDDSIADDFKITLPSGLAIQKGEIKWINPTKFNNRQDSKVSEKAEKEYEIYRLQKLKEPLLTRAKNLSLFDLLWWCLIGEKIVPQEVQNQAIEIQTDFFLTHPKRIYPDPYLFQKIVPDVKRKMSSLVDSGLGVIENNVRIDTYYAKYEDKKIKALSELTSSGIDIGGIDF